ncbi:amino acid adenylation domain-containing protein [Streptomyces sp. NBC_01450]|uniref:amino acid adenylation domain-containing protein n=1 Tax=Streptomyces sp. NBC_01450 TaxID=2903871 RepID=UPI002E36CAF3|nr:amino acid adenylation domain-containing protein [Streptomyces sp. NBC_01450]
MTCHALAASLPGAVDPGPVLDAAVRGWWPELSERWPVLWSDSVPTRFAAHRLRAELHRPVDPAGPAFRAVLLRYEDEGAGCEDGGAHLVLVAHHAVLTPAALRDIAHVLLGRRPAAEVTVPLGGHEPPKGPHRPRVDWATGDAGAGDRTGVVTVPVPAGAPAAALVLARYEHRDPGDGLPAYATVLEDPGPMDPAFSHRLAFQSAPFPLTLVPRGTTVELHHQLRHIDDACARAFARHLTHVHGQLGRVPLAEIELIPREEAERLLAPPAGKPRPDDPTRIAPTRVGTARIDSTRIDTAFDARADRHPDAPALTHDGTTTTYGALRERAERLAAGLRAAGVRPGDRVGIRLERGADLVATMLAVLKAGAAYVPMDPAHPEERLDRTARDAGVRLVVRDTAPYLGAATRIDRLRQGTGQDPAYVIHTSGSTGRPKGVVVPHTNVLALLDATREDFALTADDTWTFFHSSAFDFSVWEIWGALLTGARLVVVDHWMARSPEDFHALLVRESVTVLSQTPSAFGQLRAVDRSAKERLSVRLVVLGGEALDTRPLLGWFDRHPEDRCRLVNMYGITETTVHVTAATVTRRGALAASRSVGRPLPGWTVSVRDERGRPLPTGAAGEIWVGGAGLALGYLGRPELTAERFVTDPHRPGRWYRSGDLGRLRADGSLEHLGRIDSQVKVRGYRIELDEIRAALLEDPVVTAAAVVLSGDAFEDAAGVRIDAYVVADGDIGDVRRRAARLLPDHMLPATVTAVAALPLTPNGKLDRDRLPAPQPAKQAPEPAKPVPVAVSASPGDLVTVLTGVWEEVLGVPVGPDDNFFELGGNSLYAIRVGTALRERGLPALPMRLLYTHPTVRALSGAMGDE